MAIFYVPREGGWDIFQGRWRGGEPYLKLSGGGGDPFFKVEIFFPEEGVPSSIAWSLSGIDLNHRLLKVRTGMSDSRVF